MNQSKFEKHYVTTSMNKINKLKKSKIGHLAYNLHVFIF